MTGLLELRLIENMNTGCYIAYQIRGAGIEKTMWMLKIKSHQILLHYNP